MLRRSRSAARGPRRVVRQSVWLARDLEEALAILTRHDALDRTRDDALAWAERAKTAMAKLPEHEVRRMLIELADYVVARLT